MNLYIEGQKIELFKDENISINSSVQNIKDISKTFTDFTQSFTVPASRVNNKIFEHWYNAFINGFDARERKDAVLEINYLPFKTGRVQLNSAKKTNGVVSSYNITFFGDVVKLPDLFGEDLLTDLDLSAYAHDYNSLNVLDGLKGSYLNGDVFYPLISSERVWEFGTATDEDIKDASAPVGKGLNWFELKPALRLQRILDAIQVKYDLLFSDDFFNSDDFLKLYMWASRDKGNMRAYGDPLDMSFNGFTNFTTDTTIPYYQTTAQLIVTPQAGFDEVEYTIIRTVDGVETTFSNLTGANNVTFITQVDFNQTFNFKIQCATSLDFNAQLIINRFPTIGVGVTTFNDFTGVTSVFGKVFFSDDVVNNVTVRGQLPKMKVLDFITGLIKAFNLVLYFDGSTYKFVSLDDWYALGEVKDFSKYVDLSSEEVKRPELNKIIDFSYKEPKTILQNNFNATNNEYYGDLEYEAPYDGGNLEVSLPFENMLFSRISDNTGVLTDVMVGQSIDENLQPIKTEPLIFYFAGIRDLDDDIRVIDDSLSPITLTKYNVASQENALVDLDITRSLNWGAEVSSFSLATQQNSLFNDYWSTYISNLYDKQRREYTFKAHLPSGVLSKLQLNDKLVINRRRYIINDYTANLLTGDVTFNLLNDLNPIELTPVTNNGLEYELENGIEQ